MASVLVLGRILKDPKEGAKNGKEYVTFAVIESFGDASVYWSAVSYNQEIMGQLMRMRSGDSISVTGTLKTSLYEKDNEPVRVSHSVLVDRFVALR
jgi:single-stranded DNA-binding protein